MDLIDQKQAAERDNDKTDSLNIVHIVVTAMLPNEMRLSCGAQKKDSFHNLRAPSASSAC
jgi:hypothetical protein